MGLFLIGLIVGLVVALSPSFLVVVRGDGDTLNCEYKGVMYWLKPMNTELERNDK